MRPVIKAVFLDIDDTVLDFGACVRAAMAQGFARFHLPPYKEEMYPVFTEINNALWQGIERGEVTREELLQVRWNRIFRALHIDGDGPAFEEYFRRFLFESAIPVEGAEELVPWLGERYILCAASNGPLAQQENRLRAAGFRAYFHHLFVSEQIGAQKPSPLFFDRAVQALNAAPVPGFSYPVQRHEILMLGDSLTSDMRGGIDSGLKTCLFRPSGETVPPGYPVDAVITSLRQVPQAIKAIDENGHCA